MTMLVLKTQNLSLDEVARAVSYINGVRQEKDLEKKQLKAEDVQQIIRFVGSVNNKQCQLLKDNAVTLLRLMPSLLAAKSSMTVHGGIRIAVPVVKKMYEQNPNSQEGQKYKAILETAGKVCFHPRLTATTEERRIWEFGIFKDIIGETPEYKHALLRYQSRHKAGLKKLFELSTDAPNALPRGGRGQMLVFGRDQLRR